MSKTETSKHTIRLREGDYARLQALYPKTGANAAIRKLVSQLTDRADPPVPSMKGVEIDLTDD